MTNWYKTAKNNYRYPEENIYDFFNIIFSFTSGVEKYAKIYDEKVKQKIIGLIGRKKITPELVKEIIKRTRQPFKEISYFLFKEGYIYRDAKKFIERYIKRYNEQPTVISVANELGVGKEHVYRIYKKFIEEGLIDPENFVNKKISQDLINTIYKVYDKFKSLGVKFTINDIKEEVERITRKSVSKNTVERYLAYVKKQVPGARLDVTLHKFIQKFYVATGVGFPTALSRIPDDQKMTWISSMIDKLLNDPSELQENSDLKRFFMEKTQIRDYMSQKGQEAIQQGKTMRNTEYTPQLTEEHPSYFVQDRE